MRYVADLSELTPDFLPTLCILVLFVVVVTIPWWHKW